jgi:hypothetical protein
MGPLQIRAKSFVSLRCGEPDAGCFSRRSTFWKHDSDFRRRVIGSEGEALISHARLYEIFCPYAKGLFDTLHVRI